MTYEFIYIAHSTAVPEIIATCDIHQSLIRTRMIKEANKFFGKNNWEAIPDKSDKVIGGYARLRQDYGILRVKVKTNLTNFQIAS